MFPLNSNMPYIKDNGERDKLGNVIGSGGGCGGSITPDYENEILQIGTVGNWDYYIPMSKSWSGDYIAGYEVKTNPESTANKAMVDVFFIKYVSGTGIVEKTLLKTLIHNGDYNYSDDNIAITYTSSTWSLTCKVPLYETDGDTYTSPMTWTYSTQVDYVMLKENPVSTT